MNRIRWTPIRTFLVATSVLMLNACVAPGVEGDTLKIIKLKIRKARHI